MQLNSIKAKITLILVALLVLMTIFTTIVFIAIDKGNDDADIINAAGRQRMLSQAMAKSILGYNTAKSALEQTKNNVADMDLFITQMRTVYTKNVIGAAKKAGLAISMDPQAESHPAVPFPATLTRFVAEGFNKGRDINIDIISD